MAVGIRKSLRNQATKEGLELDHSPIKTLSLTVGEVQALQGDDGPVVKTFTCGGLGLHVLVKGKHKLV